MAIQIWFLIEVVTLVLSVPVFALEYYWVFLLGNSVTYPRNLGTGQVTLEEHPVVSILIATFNERYVIERSLEALKHLDYPKDRLQVVVADDSNDQTIDMIDDKVRDLNDSGIRAVVSRRQSREHFKCGALNKAMGVVVGDYVLLLDADSIIPADTITKGIDTMEKHPRASFVSFRYGHYNRNANLVTRMFALTQDIGDTLSKMGAYNVDAPFSYQGGMALVRAKDLRDVGLWSNERIADDADISIKMYLAGKRGIYLSSVKVMAEDPSTLEAWKKQVARTSQGWWRCIAKYGRTIVTARDVSVLKKLGLVLMLMAPFTSLSWIVVTFLSALGVVLNVVPPAHSLFSNPVYVVVTAVPIALSMASGAWALRVQGLMTMRNVVLIPALGYFSGSMLTLGSMGFFYGVFDRIGFFHYRTPKSGSGEAAKTRYFHALRNDKNAIVEGVLAVSGIALSALVLFRGVWFLSLSLVAFGAFTLWSMNLVRHLQSKPETAPASEAPNPDVLVSVAQSVKKRA
jgi:cellulose synthase/poly-beta-1,6-N-acetylglucosamine synthase-like glycosyltransferase